MEKVASIVSSVHICINNLINYTRMQFLEKENLGF